MSEDIKKMIFSKTFPTNSLPLIKKLKDKLEELNITSLSSKKARENPDIRGIMLLLNEQMYGQLATIDLTDEFFKLYNKYIKKLEEEII